MLSVRHWWAQVYGTLPLLVWGCTMLQPPAAGLRLWLPGCLGLALLSVAPWSSASVNGRAAHRAHPISTLASGASHLLLSVTLPAGTGQGTAHLDGRQSCVWPELAAPSFPEHSEQDWCQ